jgi:membrane-associated protease RseP (regulator of RpoE activity)
MSSYLVAFVLALVLHELGHLLAAHACEVRISEFGVGWGRQLYGFRFRGIDFGIRALPVGAYVRLDLNDLRKRPLGQQVLVLLAGVIVNLVAASSTMGTYFSEANFLLAATNLLPLYQQDGWKCGMVVLRGILRRNSSLVEWTFTTAGTFLSLVLIGVVLFRMAS